jgi:hypothetical protein
MESSQSRERIRTASLTPAEMGVFTIALLPVGVFLLGHLLFDVIGQAFYEHAMAILGQEGPSFHREMALEAGQVWGATALVYLVVSLCACVYLIQLLRNRVRGRAALPFLALAALLVALGVGYLLAVDAQGHPLSAVFHLTYRSLGRSGLFGTAQRLEGVRLILTIINLMSVVVPAMFCAFLPAFLLRPAEGWGEETLLERIKDGRQLGVMASLFLVAGVLHMYAWMQWSSVLLMRKELEPLAASVTLYWGCVFTTMLAVLYLPLLVALHHRAEAVMDRLDVPAKERAQWLSDRGLSYSALAQLPQMLAILAPLLTAPASKLLRTLPADLLSG